MLAANHPERVVRNYVDLCVILSSDFTRFFPIQPAGGWVLLFLTTWFRADEVFMYYAPLHRRGIVAFSALH